MLKYFYVDESGSYNTKYERYYIISGIIANEALGLQQIHKRIEKEVRKDFKGTRELKGSNMRDDQKALFINEVLKDKDFHVVSLIIDKHGYQTKNGLSVSEFLIYNFALKELCKFAFDNGNLHPNDEVLLLVDTRSMNTKIYHDLESYLVLEFYNLFKSISVVYKDSSTNRAIQLADYISNTMYGYFNKTNDAYKKIDNKSRINYKIIPKRK